MREPYFRKNVCEECRHKVKINRLEKSGVGKITQKCKIYTKKPSKKGIFIFRQRQIKDFCDDPDRMEIDSVQEDHFNHIHDDKDDNKLKNYV